jgi:hypothetical protein
MRMPTEICALAGMPIRNKEHHKAVLMKFLIRVIRLLKKIFGSGERVALTLR